MFLKSAKWGTIKDGDKYDVIIPIGSTEQHGPFLPFGTDTLIGDEIIKRLDSEKSDLIILPTLEVSCSDEHEGFLGTIWLKESTLIHVLDDICDSINNFAKNIFLVSWHGGNVSPFKRYLEKHSGKFKETPLYILDMEDDEILEETRKLLEGPCDEHAGNSEISMVMAINQELVVEPHLDYPKVKLEDVWGGEGKLWGKTKDGIVDNHPKWVFSKELGEKFIQLSVDKIKRDLELF